MGKPIIFIALNYRTGRFGFPPGTESAKAGALNLELKNQRLALEWIQKNIGYFGGDNKRVHTLYILIINGSNYFDLIGYNLR
ncbi:hypothetical protein FRC11_007484 [Ceratobasidium sp. 423]|nr:hypothetical protein FRC11_007484 [Ceratobasidium sp. 423]